MAFSHQETSPIYMLNLLSSSAEEFGFHDDRLLWELSLPQNFVVNRSHHISNKSSNSLVLGSIYLGLLTDSEKAMAPHSSVLAWRIPGMAEPGGLPSMGSHRVGHD